MLSYVGWSPTILGRVAFSRIGDTYRAGTIVCNETQGEGFVFGVIRRVSHDGPFPAWVMAWMGRFPYTDWAFFLEVKSGELPFEKDACSDAENDASSVVLRTDSKAELVGRMYLLNGAAKKRGLAALQAMTDCRDAAYLCASAKTPGQVKRESFYRSRDAMEDALQGSFRVNRRNEPTPVIGALDIVLSRSGTVKIDADPGCLLTSLALKDAHAAGESLDGLDPSDINGRHVEAIAAQAFFAIRDVTHQHYHHHSRSDLLTTVTQWTPETDEEWRRQTQYGLTRMAIAVRRQEKAQSFRQALGIIAYADAFQRHFCGWVSPTPGVVQPSRVSFKYDFAALKASIEASLKVRELKDSNRRARMFFAFGTMVTALSILVPVYRENTDPLPLLPGLFRDCLTLLVTNPVYTLAGAAAFGWAVDHAILSLSLNPDWFERVRASGSRFIGGVMGELRRRRVPAWLAQWGALTLLGLIILMSGFVTFVGYRYLYGVIEGAKSFAP